MTATTTILKKPVAPHKGGGDIVTDLFCGGGGTTTGAKKALERRGYKFTMIAINHWNLAIDTHSANHPDVTHYCQSIDTILPQEIVPGRKLKLLLASPECTDHSNAKGGKPRSDQRRADAWLLQRWIEKLDVDVLVVENVKEFLAWGPLNKKGLPDKRHRGAYFNSFVNFLKINYTVEWRILNAADFGDATTRERFIMICKKGKNRKIEFPEPTHASRKVPAKQQPDLFSRNLKPWRSAAEIIDWSIKGKSIFGRKNPLSQNTMKRIFAGLRKFSGIDLPDREVFTVKSLFSFLPKEKRKKASILFRDDFAAKIARNKNLIVPLYEWVVKDEKGKILGHYQYPDADALEAERRRRQAAVDEVVRQTPIKIDPTKCRPFAVPHQDFFKHGAAAGHGDSATSFAVNLKATDRRMRAVTDPTFTQTTGNHQYLCETSIVTNLSHTANADASMCRDPEKPLPTICGKGMLGLIESASFKLESYGEREGQSVLQDGMEMIEPCIVKYYEGSDAVSVREPAPTITASYEHLALTTPFVIPCHHGSGDLRSHSTADPMKTITRVDGFGLVQPFLVVFRKNQGAHHIDEPVKTLTTKDSYGLVEVEIAEGEMSPIPVGEAGLYIPYLGIILYVRFRMFHETELARAMGFPEDYIFTGTRQDRVTQIGNAVPCGLSEAVVYAAMPDAEPPKKRKAKAKAA